MKKQTKTKVRAGICLNRNGAWRLDLNARLVTDSDRLSFLKANGWIIRKDGFVYHLHIYSVYDAIQAIHIFFQSAWVDYKLKNNLRE